ncbi:MAG TPA: DUF3618 domain-containing protein [Stellaceae bacterium]|nr:DUF3618 domain-containing protein [Stellaceae bacterium]
MSVEPGTSDVILPDRTRDADYDGAGKSPQEIEHDIADTRAELGELLDEIERRLAPRQLLERGMNMLKDATGLGETIRRNPVPLALIGVGVGWMLLSEGTRGRVSERAGDLARQLRDKVTGSTASTEPGDPAAYALEEPAAGYAYARQKSGRVMGEAEERPSRLSDAARQGMERAGEYAGAAGERLNDMRSRIGALVEDRPLVLGVLGILAGALVALLLPRRELEDRLVGSAGEDMRRRAGQLGREAADRAQEVMERTADAAADAVRDACASDGRR